VFAATWGYFAENAGSAIEVVKQLAGGRRALVEDLMPAAALYLWQIRGRLAAHPNPVGCTPQAGRWAMLRLLEREAGHRLGEFEPDVHAEAAVTTDPEPDEFDTLLTFAPERYRDLLARRFQGDEPLTDLAADLGVTNKAVHERIARALERIRGRLAG